MNNDFNKYWENSNKDFINNYLQRLGELQLLNESKLKKQLTFNQELLLDNTKLRCEIKEAKTTIAELQRKNKSLEFLINKVADNSSSELIRIEGVVSDKSFEKNEVVIVYFYEENYSHFIIPIHDIIDFTKTEIGKILSIELIKTERGMELKNISYSVNKMARNLVFYFDGILEEMDSKNAKLNFSEDKTIFVKVPYSLFIKEKNEYNDVKDYIIGTQFYVKAIINYDFDQNEYYFNAISVL